MTCAEFHIDLFPVDARAVWGLFAPHHYLTGSYSGHQAFLALDAAGSPVAFTSSISFPHPDFANGRREHRTVVLPDFQGLGLGVRLADWLGEWHLRHGQRFFSKTTHPRMGEYRERSPLWRPTRWNRQKYSRPAINDVAGAKWRVSRTWVSFTHEYVGAATTSGDL